MSNDEVNIASYLSFQNGVWIVEVWDCIPGPAESDFHCTYSTREEAENAVKMFLSGEPTLIGGWIVPLHRHPELTVEGVKNTIASAIHVSKETFDGIAERRKKRIEHYYWVHGWRKHMWERAYQSQFLAIAHQLDNSVMLQLRRDMQECYITDRLPKPTSNQ